jgi:hypothetical protein
VVKPGSDRTPLVACTLVTIAPSASNDFQRSALLLAIHVDVLSELVQLAVLSDELNSDDPASSRVDSIKWI